MITAKIINKLKYCYATVNILQLTIYFIRATYFKQIEKYKILIMIR